MSSKPSKKQSTDVGQAAGSQPSEVWTYFNRLMDGFDVVCRQKQCRKLIERKENKQTDDMWKHLEQAHEDLYKTTERFKQRIKPVKRDLENIRMSTRSSKTTVKEEAMEDTPGSTKAGPISEKNADNSSEGSTKPGDSMPDSPRKTRKRAAVSPAAEEGEASKTAGPCEDALKTTAEPFEPKKKQPKSDDSSEPKKKAPKKDQSSEPTKKEPKARHTFEPKKKPLKADGSFEQKEKTLKDESSSGLKGKQPKADEKSYESRLIAAVRRQPGLYDPQHVDYLPKNMGKKNVALWTTVGNEIGVTDEQVHADWKILRDKFTKQRRRHEATGKAGPWPHYDKLSFLIPFLQVKKKNEGTSESTDTGKGEPQDEDAEDEEEDDDKDEDDNAPSLDDLIVAQVQPFTFLYDETHEDYGHNKKRHDAWIVVGKALEKSADAIRVRWRRLKRKFEKEVKQAGADSDALERLKKRKMAFLIPFVKHSAEGETTTNDDGSVDPEDMPEVTVEIPKFEEREQDQEDADDAEPIEIDDDDTADGSEKDDDEENGASKTDENEGPKDAVNGAEVAARKQGQRSAAPAPLVGSPRKPGPSKLPEDEEESDDEDELFLRTLRCKFRKMDEATKERTKAKLMATLVDVNYGPK